MGYMTQAILIGLMMLFIFLSAVKKSSVCAFIAGAICMLEIFSVVLP